MRYYTPRSCEEAVAILASGPHDVLAGGTDYYPALRDRPATRDLIDISRIDELRTIRRQGDGWRLGAATTWSDVARTNLPPLFHGLQAAAREVGALQVQNAGTIAGNICNASPAADGVPPLLTLDAEVEIASCEGRRTVPLSAFITGVRRTVLRPGELVTAILVPHRDAASAFLKLGARRYLVISIAMVAVLLEPDGSGRVAQARIAVGACSAVARRIEALESELAGQPMNGEILASVVELRHLCLLSPIDDVRADRAYRLEAAAELIRRALRAALATAGERAA
ncbi:FAD binding domain-containing protein [Rhizobium azibense]|uniref:CO/xanthine dehydrogenase FAD-binding subunit n=1 Tax=Rhizobium azibense TaxID=1136135 RepID=A0A4V2VEV3_9HYPH|nr:FAD binding domain-containing protein [Rhizobium azibense]TCU38015.1 CO/xanthine dehydrogenase FAD-binding subunit [Rhizobium azibense]